MENGSYFINYGGRKMKQDLLTLLKEEKIIAIVRGIDKKSVERTVHALRDGNITFLEITMDTEGALDSIYRLKGMYGEHLRIGAGTVLNIGMAKEAIQAGAEYIVSPNLDEQVVTYCLEQNVDVWPGTMTPTEMYKAYQLGAKAVKVFPIGTLGTKYIREVKAPLGQIEMIATGGVNLENINSILENGAIAAGVGGNLVDKKFIQLGNFEEITKRARMFVKCVKGENYDDTNR